MPRTTDPDKYPAEFFELARRASAGTPVRVPIPPGKGPAGLRGYLQAFLRALETKPEWIERAKALSVFVEDGAVVVADRSQGKYASLVRDALGGSVEDEAEAAQRALLGSLPL